MGVGDTLAKVGKALVQHGDQLPEILDVGAKLWKAVQGDKRAALAAIRQAELAHRKSIDARIGRTRR